MVFIAMDCDYWHCETCSTFYHYSIRQPFRVSELGYFKCASCYFLNRDESQ